MKKMLTAILLAGLTLNVFAQETLEVDITKLSQQELVVYQKMKQMQAESALSLQNVTPDTITRYAEVGKAFGTAFKECWETVSDDAEKFANSDAGKLTMILIAWKIVGQDGINLLEKGVQWSIGIPLFFVGTGFFIWLVRRNCTKRPRLKSATKVWWFTVKREYEGIVDPIHGDEAMILYAICYAAFFGLCCILIFVG